MRMYTSNQYSYVRGSLRECLSIQSGTSGLPYYCTPLVFISAVIELLTVWQHKRPKTKTKNLTRFIECVWVCVCVYVCVCMWMCMWGEGGDVCVCVGGVHICIHI